MPTESEILDQQTQTLEEALDRLSERDDDITPEKTVVPDVNGDGLQIAVECIRTLADLHRTISVEGVSKADIQALRAIQARMAPHARLPSKVALEDYEGMFTPTRSLINQTVSQEASLAEIGKTIKEWFFIFVDFLIRVADWARRVWNSEELIRARLKLMDTNLQSMCNQVMDLVKYGKTLGRDPYEKLMSLADTVLDDPKLPRTESMLQAFNVSKGTSLPGTAIKMIDKSIDANFERLMKEVSSLKTHIEQNKPMSIGVSYDLDFGINAQLLQDMTVAMDDPEFFKQKVRRDFWTDPKKLISRPIFAPSHNIEQVQRLSKEIRGIKRNANFDALSEVDIIVKTIENLSQSVKHLEEIIKFKQMLYADYYKASATYANFYIRAREYIEEDIRTHAADDFDKQLIKRMTKTWEDLLNRMGI